MRYLSLLSDICLLEGQGTANLIFPQHSEIFRDNNNTQLDLPVFVLLESFFQLSGKILTYNRPKKFRSMVSSCNRITFHDQLKANERIKLYSCLKYEQGVNFLFSIEAFRESARKKLAISGNVILSKTGNVLF